MGTTLSDWTMTTISLRKVDMNDSQATIVNLGSPNDTLMSLGTDDNLIIPIHFKLSSRKLRVILGLPTGIDPNSSNQFNSIACLTINNMFSCYVPRIYQMLFG